MKLADQHYGSILVRHPDSTPMFRCTKKRADWYLKRNLAKWLDDGSAQLLFQPKGKGHSNDVFYLENKDCLCVVCGTKDNLTRHHCVPYCYRRFFPPHIKSRDHHDIVLVCRACHNTYEEKALLLKKEMGARFGDPLDWGDAEKMGKSQEVRKAMRIKSCASALKRHKLGEVNIPIDRKLALEVEIQNLLGHVPDLVEIDALLAQKTIDRPQPHGEIVVKENINNLQGFIEIWRRHFVDTMQPKFLSLYWKIERQFRQS